MKKLNLTDNLFLKILSVLVAIVLWLAVVNVSDAEGTKSFPLGVALLNTEVITENGKVFRVENNSDVVRVTVRARQSVLRNLNQSDFTLTADMKKDLKYDSLVGISVQCKNKDIIVEEHVSLDRKNVEVSIEDSATEQFPVHVGHTGEPAKGLVVGNLVPEQTVIKITGPVSIVERIKYVEALVDVTGMPRNTSKNCTLKLYDAAGGMIDTTYLNYIGKEDGIDVAVSLLNTKTVPMRFGYSGTPAENYQVVSVSCKPETIDIAGTSDVLGKIIRLDISPEAVNVDGIDEELQLVVDVSQYLPEGMILENEDDGSVVVTVEVMYVEPVVEEEVDEEDSTESDKPSSDKKPSSEKTEESDKKEDTEPENKGDVETGTQDKEDSSAESGKNEVENSDKTETGENGKTESNS